MKSSNIFDIVIVGGGFSAVDLATHINNYNSKPPKILIVYKNNPLGHGIAYSTDKPWHLLNVPAQKMSAFETLPDDFVNWLKLYSNLRITDTNLFEYFAPRYIYAQYINDNLVTPLQKNESTSTLCAEIFDIQHSSSNNYTLLDVNSKVIAKSKKVVLALGNPPPSELIDSNIPCYVNNPWEDIKIDHIPSRDTVLIVGTGLTMIDTVLTLINRDHQGKIIAISRHGYLPMVHKNPLENTPSFIHPPASLKKILQEFKILNNLNTHWRNHIDSLRPLTQDFWLNFSLFEKKQFLRHLQAKWDVHRHRIAPEIFSKIQTLKNLQQLEFVNGRICKIEYNKKITVNFKSGLKIESDWLINCTGPNLKANTKNIPLLNNLLKRGMIQLDPLNLGLNITKQGQLIQNNHPSSSLFAIGPLCKGILWEIIAVPDIRKQVDVMARSFFSDFS